MVLSRRPRFWVSIMIVSFGFLEIFMFYSVLSMLLSLYDCEFIFAFSPRCLIMSGSQLSCYCLVLYFALCFFLSPFLPALKMWFWVHLHFAKSCILGSSLYFPYIITLLINMNNLWHKNFNSQTSRASCFRHTCELCISNFSCVTNQTHSRKLT